MDATPTAAPWSPPFEAGDPVPWFEAPSPGQPHFHFSTTTGRYVLLGFLPPPGVARDAAFAAFSGVSAGCGLAGTTVAMPRSNRPSRSEPVMIRRCAPQTRMMSWSITSSSGRSG